MNPGMIASTADRLSSQVAELAPTPRPAAYEIRKSTRSIGSLGRMIMSEAVEMDRPYPRAGRQVVGGVLAYRRG